MHRRGANLGGESTPAAHLPVPCRHERATGPKKLITIPSITHYGIYNEAREQAKKEAIAWFDEHLKR